MTCDKEALRDVFISVLNSPIPETPAVGSVYDILKDLDALLPAGGTLTVSKSNGKYRVTVEPK